MNINLGYCCISVTKDNLKCSQSSTKTWLDSHTYGQSRHKLLEKANSNLDNLERLLHHNATNGIYAFRLPEQLLPQFDLGYYDIAEFSDRLATIGEIANSYDMQLSQHPSQYYVLNSLNQSVVDKTIASLNTFADILDMMQLVNTPNLTIHVGARGGYADEDAAIDAFCHNFQLLNDNAKRFLVVENDQNSFDIINCLAIHDLIGIPVVLDNAHHNMNNPDGVSLAVAVKLVLPTWGKRIPKFHLSSEDSQARHSHDDYVTIADYLSLVNPLTLIGPERVVIMCEAKKKDEAVLRLMQTN